MRGLTQSMTSGTMNLFNLRLWCLLFYFVGHTRQSEYASSSMFSKAKPYYKAGVVEYAPEHDDVDSNLERFTTIIESDEAHDIDILVFPEFALNSISDPIEVPNAKDLIRPCGQPKYSNVMKTLSCSANRARKYVVINVTMKLNCSDDGTKSIQADESNVSCPKRGYYLHNTAVVFDRNGIVISTYRKFNLFGDIGISQTDIADYSTFTTDFNVTFGLIICFDIIMERPAIDLVKRGVRNFIMPTMWYSELPFMSSLQVQQSWSYAHNVNLLAAGISSPDLGYSGSGIYSGHNGALNAVISDTPLTKLLVAYVPKVPGTNLPKTISPKNKTTKHPESNPAMIFSKENLPDLDFHMLNFTQSNRHEGKICKNDFCCHYAIEVFTHKLPSNASFYSYAVAVHNGMISFKPYSNAVIYGTMCSLVACSNANTCDLKFTNSQTRFQKYVFKRLQLFGKFPSNRIVKSAPNTLTTSLMPLQQDDFVYTESSDYVVTESTKRMYLQKDVSMRLTHPRSDLITFAIYQRNYPKDTIASHGHTIVPTTTIGIVLIAIIVSIERTI